MENNLMTLNLSEDMIKGIVDKQIQQAIVKQLGNAEEYMEGLISSALHQKVDSSGKISQYSSYNKYDYLDIALKKNIRIAVDEAIKEWIKENQELLKKQLKKHMSKDETKNQFIDAFTNGLTNCFESSYRINCAVSFTNPKEHD